MQVAPVATLQSFSATLVSDQHLWNHPSASSTVMPTSMCLKLSMMKRILKLKKCARMKEGGLNAVINMLLLKWHVKSPILMRRSACNNTIILRRLKSESPDPTL